MKHLSILGSTGSIGTQTLEVVRNYPNDLCVDAISFGTNIKLGLEQIIEFRPKLVSVLAEEYALELKKMLFEADQSLAKQVEILFGQEGNIAVATYSSANICVAAMVGVAGLLPVVEAIKARKDIALANKETLVAGGDVVMPLVKETGVKLLPVDSEHSAIWQCLWGQPEGSLDRILLTASGGPFRGYTREQLESVTLEQALNHPTWKMGGKITVDSSTMMNKGLEVIEAKHLFNKSVDDIDVVVHPQSIIHSMVRMSDGSVLGQMGKPSMMMPILVALFYPERKFGFMEKFDPFAEGVRDLSFEPCDKKVFRLLDIAYEAGRQGGLVPVVMNRANEEAVNMFLNKQIGYLDIEKVVERTIDVATSEFTSNMEITLDNILAADRRALEIAREII